MDFEFDYERTLEATSYLIHLNGGRINYFQLMKLLYLAEREVLAETATPLTGDECKAMDRGPVLSTVLDLIRQSAWTNRDWQEHIRTVGDDVVALDDRGTDHLSRFIIDKLRAITERYRDQNEWGLVALTREFPEWAKNRPDPGRRKTIPLRDMMIEGMGQDPEILQTIGELERERRATNQIFEDLKAANNIEEASA